MVVHQTSEKVQVESIQTPSPEIFTPVAGPLNDFRQISIATFEDNLS
jgi:hypothetical protein